MKLATLKDSTRDGRLVVVSRDLTRCSEVGHIARTLQAALDDWEHVAPRLALIAQGIETGAQPAAASADRSRAQTVHRQPIAEPTNARDPAALSGSRRGPSVVRAIAAGRRR